MIGRQIEVPIVSLDYHPWSEQEYVRRSLYRRGASPTVDYRVAEKLEVPGTQRGPLEYVWILPQFGGQWEWSVAWRAVKWQELSIRRSSERERGNGGRAEAWGYTKHQYSLNIRLALLTKPLGVPEGNLSPGRKVSSEDVRAMLRYSSG